MRLILNNQGLDERMMACLSVSGSRPAAHKRQHAISISSVDFCCGVLSKHPQILTQLCSSNKYQATRVTPPVVPAQEGLGPFAQPLCGAA